jgi:hypothetical protein
MIYSCEAFYNGDKKKRGGISITFDDGKRKKR